jgi:dCTP deaminase
MIVNGRSLYTRFPLDPMLDSKVKAHGVSHGLSEAGYDICIRESVVLHPLRRFTLASTIERFRMPDNLVGVVHDKSSWARQGLSVFNTVIEPSWEGWLTLELVYHGWRVLRIPAGAGIAQVLFHQTVEPARYAGKYQHQPARPVAAILEKG